MARILVLDDDRSFRRLVVTVIGGRGHEVAEAESGAAASAALVGATYDLLIVDGLLPDGDGPTWIERTRRDGCETPVIFVSHFWRDREHRARLEGLRVSRVIHKPIAPGDFADQVDALLGHEPPKAGDAGEELDFAEALAQLKRVYARELPTKLAGIAEALRQARAFPEDAKVRGRAKSAAHKLRGSAGSHGFAEVGQAAGRIEEALILVDRGDRSPADASLWEALDRAVEEAAAASGAPVDEEAEDGGAPCEKGGSDAAVVLGAALQLLAFDADPAGRRTVSDLGRRECMSVLAAATADESLRRAATERLDAALLAIDPAAPEVAYALARALRDVPGCQDLPLGFTAPGPGALGGGDPATGSDIALGVDALHAGASLLLSRPLEAEAFGAAVRRLAAARIEARPSVLVVDDDPAFLSHVQAILEGDGLRVSSLERPEGLLSELQARRPDVLLLDVEMPRYDGFQLCRLLRASPRWQDLSIIFVTARAAPSDRAAGFRAGADDYVAKPVVAEELLARIRGRVERTRLLRERADRDALTGLSTRRALVDAVVQRLAEARRHARPLSIALLDVDGLRAVNEAHGHGAGDRVLEGLGRLLTNRFRVEDLRGRWGGEEILLAFPGASPESISGALSRVLAEFAAIHFRPDTASSAGAPAGFGASFTAGLAGFPEDGVALNDLLRVAARRMAAAKSQGGKRVVSEG